MKDIDPQGAANLIEAIVRQAAWDVLHSKPNSETRMRTERFFLSRYFTRLTGLDGKIILKQLRAMYDKKHPPKGRRG